MTGKLEKKSFKFKPKTDTKMGLFSDHDINEAERALGALQPPIDRETKILILRGFEKGWKALGDISGNIHYDESIREQVITLRNEATRIKVENLTKKPFDFGYILGCLIGTLRFHPTSLLKYGDKRFLKKLSRSINSLRKISPIHDLVIRYLREWQEWIVFYSRFPSAILYRNATVGRPPTEDEKNKMRQLYELFVREVGL
ncbi:hypothetical protein HYV80_06415 [Candidatus Woesearchaeota archaeon]|nr:hypothetical protein [Candidatus Woesearchaeota archaeon]